MPKVFAALAAIICFVVAGCGGGHAGYVPPGDGGGGADGDAVADAGGDGVRTARSLLATGPTTDG